MGKAKNDKALNRLLDQLKLPGKDQLQNNENPYPLYEPILNQLGAKTREDIDKLRMVVGDRIQRMSDEIVKQNMRDFMAGKIKRMEDMPLYRKKTPEGETLENVPEEMMAWFAFMAFLNEKSEDLKTGPSGMLN